MKSLQLIAHTELKQSLTYQNIENKCFILVKQENIPEVLGKKKSSPPTPLKTGIIRSNRSIKSKLWNGKRKSPHKFGGDLQKALHEAVSCLGR